MLKRQHSSLSIYAMLLRSMLGITLVMVLAFVSILMITDFSTSLRGSEEAKLARSVQHQAETVQRYLSGISSSAEHLAQEVGRDTSFLLAQDTNVAANLQGSHTQTRNLLISSLNHAKSTIQNSGSTGAFVLLDSSLSQAGQGFAQVQTAGIYVRSVGTGQDHPPVPTLLDGPKTISRSMDLPAHPDWDPELKLSSFSDFSFIDRLYAMHAAEATEPQPGPEEQGAWFGPLSYRGVPAYIYAVPLLDSQDVPYGIVGIEVSLETLQSAINPTVFDSETGTGFSLLAFYPDGLQNPPGGYAFSGAKYSPEQQEQIVEACLSAPLSALPSDQIISFDFEKGPTLGAFVRELPHRLPETGGNNGSWRLFGGTSTGFLYKNANQLVLFFVAAVALSMAAGISISLIGANAIVTPFRQVSDQLRDVDPVSGVSLSKMRIREFDELIDAIEALSRELAETGDRTLQTIAMTGISMGFYEIDLEKKRVFTSDMIFDLFGIEKENGNLMSLDRWNETSRLLIEYPNADKNLFVFHRAHHDTRWLQIKTAYSQNKTFGIITDVTDDVAQRRQLEYARDTDILTGLHNRRSFFVAAHEIIGQHKNQFAAMIFSDLDNLKYVNDTYGHEYGDLYIRTAANAFNQLAQENNGIAARISGDEFAVFLFDSSDIDETVNNVRRFDIGLHSIDLPDGSSIKIRASMGIARYPTDSTDLETLLKYADFAMYEIKRTQKGSIREFSAASYLKNSFLVEKNEVFNLMLEQNLVRYAFQPIVDTRTGEVFAYEALMRPLSDDLPSLEQAMALAQAQAKLYQIERMTCFNICRWLSDNRQQLGDRLLFFNTIPNQILSEADQAELERKYGDLFPQTVAEITGRIDTDNAFLAKKTAVVHKMGISTALDDFGSSGDNMLLQIAPHYIKIDAGLVKEVNLDEDKQKLVSNIIGYAKPRGIKIIAVGIETLEEMETLIRLGADYLQGYILGRPEYTLQEPPAENLAALKQLAGKYLGANTLEGGLSHE